MAEYARLLRVALGQDPADLVLRGVTLLNVVTRDSYPATIGICEDTIAYVTTPDDPHCEGLNVIDCTGLAAAPGLIVRRPPGASPRATPEFFGADVVPRGVTTV